MANITTDPKRLEELNEISRTAKTKDLSLITKFQTIFVNRKAKDIDNRSYVGVIKPLGMFAHRPFLDLPFNKPMSVNSVNQYPSNPFHCQIMERDLFRCINRVGEQNMRTKCRIYFEDYNECFTNEKAIKRKKAMMLTRKLKNEEATMELPAGI